MIDHIHCDLDGVVTDWTGGVIRLYGMNPGRVYASWPHGIYDLSTVLRVSKSDMWRRVNMSGAHFWASLQPYPWALSLHSLCRSFAPTTFLSTTSKNSHSGSGKMQWLSQHFPNVPFFVGSAPKSLCAGPGRVLIDDKDSNCRDFIQAGGSAIVFPQPWNSGRAWTANRTAYIREQLREIV